MTINVPSLAELADPGRAALLIIDVQAHAQADDHYLVDVPAAVGRFVTVAEAAKAAGVTRIYTRGVESPESDTDVWVSRHVTKPFRVNKRLKGSPGAEFHPDLQPDPDDLVFVKTRYSCFFGTGLEEVLRQRGIDTLFMAGIATNICVEITARDAFQRDFWTVVIGDCCATRSQEEQDRALHEIDYNWGQVVQAADVLDLWQPGAPR
jgi:nicotinamidase-related amidase